LHAILQVFEIGIFPSSAQSSFLQHFPQLSSSAHAGGKIAAAISDVIFKQKCFNTALAMAEAVLPPLSKKSLETQFYLQFA